MTATQGLPTAPAERLRLTPGRVTALVIGTPVALAVICAVAVSIVAGFATASTRVARTVALPGAAATADVTVNNPGLTLRAAAAGSRLIRVRGTLTGAFVRPVFDLRPTARGVAMTSRCVVPTGSCSGTLDVTVPAGLPVLASDATGNLDAAGLGGRITLSDGSGDLAAARLSGTISLSDGTGDLSATGLSGGSIKISDGTGDVTVTGLAGTDVAGSAGSGDLMLGFTDVPRRVDVSDSTGDITLILPHGPAYYQVSARSSTGVVSVGVRQRSSSPYVITARAGSGNVTIEY